MASWHESLRSYRRRSLQGAADESSDVMFVLCSENHAAAALLAPCEPALVLQTFGGARHPADAAVQATFDYAIKLRGVRHVIVCGHSGCRAFDIDECADPRKASQAQTVEQCRRLRSNGPIGGLMRDYGISLRALWLDEREGDVYACDLEGRTATLMSDEDFGRMLTHAAPA